MSTYIFSALNEKYTPPAVNSFYSLADKELYENAGTWPDNYIDVSDDIFAQFTGTPPAGKTLGSVDGNPAWVKIPEPPLEQQIEAANNLRDNYLSIATNKIVVWQTKLLIGRKLTASETEQLNAWLDYIDALDLIDTSKPSGIVWPDMPS